LLPFTSPLASQRANAALRDRLAQANILRQSGHWREAEAAYLEIARQYSAAPEFEVASLAAAALRLEHLNDPQGALHLYESLAPEAALSPEARYGVARCHRALGDVVAEDAALSALIDHAPNSIQVERARQRLTQLRSKKGTGRISDGANPN
jgi:tetratricopeptide (TPR) repeat protein